MEGEFKNTPQGLIALLEKVTELKKEIRGIEHVMDDSELGIRVTLAVENSRREIASTEELILSQISISELNLTIIQP